MSSERTKVQKSNRVEMNYYSNGIILSKTPFINDKKHGVESWWWDGRKQWEIMWRDGKQHGVETDWFENGQKNYETYYFLGKKSAWIEWDEKGDVAKVTSRTPAQAANSKPAPKGQTPPQI